MAFRKLYLGVVVLRVELNAFLKVFNCIFGFEDGGIRNGAAEVCLREQELLGTPNIEQLPAHGSYLYKRRVEFYRLGGIGDSISKCFRLDIRLELLGVSHATSSDN